MAYGQLGLVSPHLRPPRSTFDKEISSCETVTLIPFSSSSHPATPNLAILCPNLTPSLPKEVAIEQRGPDYLIEFPAQMFLPPCCLVRVGSISPDAEMGLACLASVARELNCETHA